MKIICTKQEFVRMIVNCCAESDSCSCEYCVLNGICPTTGLDLEDFPEQALAELCEIETGKITISLPDVIPCAGGEQDGQCEEM